MRNQLYLLNLAAAFLGLSMGACTNTHTPASRLEQKIIQASVPAETRHYALQARQMPAAYYEPCTTDPEFRDDDDTTLLARLVFGESRSNHKGSKAAVAYTVVNRANNPSWWGSDIRDVALCPKQYSCFNFGNRSVLMAPLRHEPLKVWQECYDVAAGVLADKWPDLNMGQTHFVHYRPSTGRLTDNNPVPKWVRSMEFLGTLVTGRDEQLWLFRE